MKQLKSLSIYLILLYSEALWMVYAIIFFTGNERGIAPVFDLKWWIIACIAGFVLNVLLAGRVPYFVMVFGNGIVLTGLIILNWLSNMPELTLGLGIALSIAVSVLFIRSANFIYREPSRTQMMGHFEGNIVLYVIYVLLFSLSDWFQGTVPFHMLFLFAIFMSLIGMVFTLQSHEINDGQQETDIQKVGQSGWFVGVITFLLASLSLLCLVMLIPSIRTGLHAVAITLLSGAKWVGTSLMNIAVFLFNLFPELNSTGELPPPSEEQPNFSGDGNEEIPFTIPIEWMFILVGAIAVIVIAVWMVTKWLKNKQPPQSVKLQSLKVVRGSWWKTVVRKMIALYHKMVLGWKMRFPRFYHFPIYWQYHQLEKWGRKNGIIRLKHETSMEYVEKVIDYLEDVVEGKNYEVKELLHQLNHTYQSTYYGSENGYSVNEFKSLINDLKKLRNNQKNNASETKNI
ncbi:hypothetical protein DCC39_15885 [Pueribacillus theae]|uniref:DUF4129 domain-containing protein n=1 Tax=Pueribacillus theae TaxID=2171751 RepID=A0A2U1JSR8_9BACI|nr:hypothetical protein [Pueribacillus theae]PWA07923.1 hypothetical protein DCC39_15885 [Pueribacillus theae]